MFEYFILSNLVFAIDVVNRVRNGESVPYRPLLPETTEIGHNLIDLIMDGWAENIERRPLFPTILRKLRKISGGE